jgi:hypothetical protein
MHTLLSERSGELQNLLDTKAPLIAELISSRGGEIAKELADVGELVTNTIESRGTAIVQHLAQRQQELTEAIETSSAALREAVDTSANTSIASMIGANDRLKGEMSGILDRLGQTNVSLQSIISQASGNLTAIEAQLTSNLGAFGRAIESVSEQVSQLGEVATQTLSGADAVSHSLGAHSEALLRTTSELENSHVALDTALANRHQSLEQLLGDIEGRRGDFENVLQAFSGLIEDAFRDAEARARDIGTFLVESTQHTTHSVEEGFAEIRAATGKERERTAAALRAAYEQATGEMADLLDRANQGFQAAAEEIRGVTTEIRAELEATREEVRRGAIELPRETAEQTGVMRRVVSEQIKALNELTDIVARSGRAFDVAEPASLISPTRPPDPPAPRPSAPPRSPEPARTGEFARPVDAAQREVQTRPRAPAARVPQIARAEERGPTPAVQDRSQEGWLTDLLARASREEPEDPAQAEEQAGEPNAEANGAIDSIDALSLDIAHLLDHDAVAELWDRYRRGERHVFTRRLYSPQGQQAFDAIRRRYRSDEPFRDTVDRYIHEFERLLTEVTRDDPENPLAKTYLTSETGKVYTMLAHAANRFE